LNYEEENGRTYHAYKRGRYLFPNDETEADRLDMVHEMTMEIMDQRLHFAPLEPSIQAALDVGTGTGLVSFHLFCTAWYNC
jgi:methylase of polypeptide subunit release factors